MYRLPHASLCLLVSVIAACGESTPTEPTPEQRPANCPANVEATLPLPGVNEAQLTPSYWIDQLQRAGLEPQKPVLNVAAIERYNDAVGRKPGNDDHTQRNLLMPVNVSELRKSLDERLGYMHKRLSKQELRSANGDAVGAEVLQRFSSTHLPATVQPSLRITTAPVAIRCGPLDTPLAEQGSDPAYDRNACSTMQAQEAVQLIARWPDKLWLVRTRHSLGFISEDAALSPSVPGPIAARVANGARLRTAQEVTLTLPDGSTLKLPSKTTLPVLTDDTRNTLVATDKAIHTVAAPSAFVATKRELTRAAVVETAFQYLGLPYGFGGAAGGYDCSGLLLDVFESFDVALPRHSGWQAQTGSFVVDLSKTTDEQEKLALLDAAQARGVVLLHFPGHIMLYLGRDAAGTPMALHALGEYARPCDARDVDADKKPLNTVVAVRRVVVSNLELGRGSKRTSFIERLTKLVVFGAAPDAKLVASSGLRPAAQALISSDSPCEGSTDARIFFSPQRPVAGQPLTLIATTTNDLRPARLQVFDDKGAPVSLTSHALGGPPYTEWMRVAQATAGTWTAVIADGVQVRSCRRIAVRAGPYAEEPRAAEGRPVWEPRWAWERDTENLWSAFVEQLFDDPDPERTWTNLHTLLRDPERNLLHNHLGLDEDKQLELVPDCADLPYSLRAYFSWKLSLPYAYRLCSRGRPGRPPTCGMSRTNLMPREVEDDVEAFSIFVNRYVRSGVHSASGRTAPNDDATDLYPVPLTREALPAGTVYADPYGHVMMLSKWIPQGIGPKDGYGILMATEAQPDGTIGRRRFWRGSFLFEPDTSEVGAGFKQFRPMTYDRVARDLVAPDNATLARQQMFPRFSTAQYDGGMDGFYDSMEALINPRPLDAERLLLSLIDALQESAERRVLSVDTGEQHMREHPGHVVPMPDGHDVFETAGPWEDFSTPSRDMRLLIAIDTVLDVPERLKRAPERFGITDNANVNALVTTIQKKLDSELRARTFNYHRSDGSDFKVSLKDIVDRAVAFETAYNPNDCPEVRWGAPLGSDEISTCTRHAPPAQRAKLEKYRSWFHTRHRPAR